MTPTLSDLQLAVGNWGAVTFPGATYEQMLAHLSEEVNELAFAIVYNAPESIAEETADCLLLLLHVAYKTGFDLFEAASRKHTINLNRRWMVPPGLTYAKHVEPEGDAPDE